MLFRPSSLLIFGIKKIQHHPLDRSFLPRRDAASYYRELPRPLREDPDLEGHRWTQAVRAAAPRNSAEARRLRPVNIVPNGGNAGTNAQAENRAPNAQQQQKPQPKHPQSQPEPHTHQRQRGGEEAMLDQIVGRLKYEYAQKLAEEQYITNRLVELGINPDVLSRRRSTA